MGCREERGAAAVAVRDVRRPSGFQRNTPVADIAGKVMFLNVDCVFVRQNAYSLNF